MNIDKQFIKVPIVKENRLGLAERVVYARLVYLSEYGQGASASVLSEITSLTFRTVSKALKALDTDKLVSQIDKQWFAQEPSDWSWFGTIVGDCWQRRFQTWRMYCRRPNAAFSFIDVALYYLLVSFTKSRGPYFTQPDTGLATMLGIERRTVARSSDRLVDGNLIERAKDSIFVLPPTKAFVECLRDRPVQKVQGIQIVMADGEGEGSPDPTRNPFPAKQETGPIVAPPLEPTTSPTKLNRKVINGRAPQYGGLTEKEEVEFQRRCAHAAAQAGLHMRAAKPPIPDCIIKPIEDQIRDGKLPFSAFYKCLRYAKEHHKPRNAADPKHCGAYVSNLIKREVKYYDSDLLPEHWPENQLVTSLDSRYICNYRINASSKEWDDAIPELRQNYDEAIVLETINACGPYTKRMTLAELIAKLDKQAVQVSDAAFAAHVNTAAVAKVSL